MLKRNRRTQGREYGGGFNTKNRSSLRMSIHHPKMLLDRTDTLTLDEAGNLCDIKGLPLPLSQAIQIRNLLNLSVAKADPSYLADLYNRRLSDWGDHYLEQFGVDPKDMA